MSTFLLIILLVVNTGVSIWDAYIAGRIWRESTGFMKLVAWASVIISACGFLSVSTFLLARGAVAVNLMTEAQFSIVLKLTFVLMVVPVLSAGAVITIQSWIDAIKTRSLTSGGVAAWNTFAQIANTVEAVESTGGFLRDIFDYFNDDDSDEEDEGIGKTGIIVIVFIAAAISVGLTYLFWGKGRLRAISDEINEARERATQTYLPYSGAIREPSA